MSPVSRAVTAALEGGGSSHRGGVLEAVHVDRGVREVGDAARVVEIEVREHDVANVLGAMGSKRRSAACG